MKTQPTGIMTPAESAAFWRSVDRSADPCWTWAGPHRQTYVAGREQHTPRLALAEHLGRNIAANEDVVRVCTTASCVRPEHLAAVSPQRRAQKRSADARGASPYLGVSWNAARSRWRVQLRLGPINPDTGLARLVSLGYYADDTEAAYVAQIARLLGQPGAGLHERPLPPIMPHRYLRLFTTVAARLKAEGVALVDRSFDDVAVLRATP